MTHAQLSTDVREHLLAALDAGLSRDDAVLFFGVSHRTLARWIRRKRETGSAAASPGRGRRARIGPDQEETVRMVVATQPDATLAELCDLLAEETGIRISPSTMCRRLRSLDITRKKRR
jgi:transposase